MEKGRVNTCEVDTWKLSQSFPMCSPAMYNRVSPSEMTIMTLFLRFSREVLSFHNGYHGDDDIFHMHLSYNLGYPKTEFESLKF